MRTWESGPKEIIQQQNSQAEWVNTRDKISSKEENEKITKTNKKHPMLLLGKLICYTWIE